MPTKTAFTIVRDTREQTPWQFPAEQAVTVAKLDTGDYSIDGWQHRICIERKSLDDLVGSVLEKEDRFLRELSRMAIIGACGFAAIVVEGGIDDVRFGRYYSKVTPESLAGKVAWLDFRFRHIKWHFAHDAETAAWWAHRQLINAHKHA